VFLAFDGFPELKIDFFVFLGAVRRDLRLFRKVFFGVMRKTAREQKFFTE
jgi:hypothetical protein